jgi:hypothetical protein
MATENDHVEPRRMPAGVLSTPVRRELGVVRLIRNKTSTMVTIPKVWVNALRWVPGDHIQQELKDGNLVLTNLSAVERARQAAQTEDAHALPFEA